MRTSLKIVGLAAVLALAVAGSPGATLKATVGVVAAAGMVEEAGVVEEAAGAVVASAPALSAV
jgi:hypothetical protein